MSKTINHYDDDDDLKHFKYKENKYTLKRQKRALSTRNIQDLLDLEDDDYFNYEEKF